MSSFEQFRRSQHSRSGKSSQASFRSFEADPPNLANLAFSTNQVAFAWSDAQDSLASQELRVTNHTNTRLYFQLAVTYPDYYDIRPRQDILEPNATASVAFRLNKRKLLEHGDRSVHPFDRVKAFLRSNAVQFSWGQITEENIKYNEVPPTKHHQSLTVVLQGQASAAQDRPSPRAVSLSKQSQQPSVKQSQQVSVKESRVMGEPMFEDSREAEGEYSSLLTIPIMAAVAVCSFLVGFISA